MATLRLNECRVDALKSRKSAYDIRDRELTGFGVRVLPSGGKRYFIHSQHRRRRVWEDRRRGKVHRRGRGPSPSQGHAGIDPKWNRRAGRSSTGHPLRNRRRRGVPAIRPKLETLDPQSQPELLPRPYSTVVRRTPDWRYHRPRRTALVRIAPQYAGIGRPVCTHPVCHHAPGRSLRLQARGNQSLRGHQALSASGAGALPVGNRIRPDWAGCLHATKPTTRRPWRSYSCCCSPGAARARSSP